MTTAFSLAALGLLLLAPAHPARRRLAALVGSRLASPVSMDRRSPSFSFRLKAIVVAAAAGSVAAFGVGPVPGLLTAVCVLAAGWVRRSLSAERNAAAAETRMVALVAAIAAEQAAGAGLGAAMRHASRDAGPWRPALERASLAALNGDDPAAGLGHETLLIPFAVAIAVASRTGAGLTDVLARVRSELESRQECRRAVAQAVAGPRSSALLLSLLPVVGLGMGAALGAQPWHVLTATPAGLLALTVGVLLELAGLMWTMRLTR